MNRASRRYTPLYDLFKLIIAVILTIVFVLLLLRERTERAIPPVPRPAATFTSATEPLPATALPTQTVAPLPTLTVTSSPAPPTQAFPTSDANACPASPSHIQVGDQVRVRSWLNFRTGPGLSWPIIHTNTSGTIMEVVGGPFCTTKDTAEGPRAYLWWNVRMENGRTGWSAEAPLIDPEYFLEPVP